MYDDFVYVSRSMSICLNVTYSHFYDYMIFIYEEQPKELYYYPEDCIIKYPKSRKMTKKEYISTYFDEISNSLGYLNRNYGQYNFGPLYLFGQFVYENR